MSGATGDQGANVMQRVLLIEPSGVGITGTAADTARAQRASSFLWQVVAAAQQQIDPAMWVAAGGPDALEFLNCLKGGQWHPALREWDHLKSQLANRPPPIKREQTARHIATLLVDTLEGAGVRPKLRARKTAAKGLKKAKVFATPPTARTLEYWEQTRVPSESDAEIVTKSIAFFGQDVGRILFYFVEWVRVGDAMPRILTNQAHPHPPATD
jgi:hypothetical protein